MNIQKIRQVLIFLGLLSFSSTVDHYIFSSTVKIPMNIIKTIYGLQLFSWGIKQTLSFPVLYASQYLSLFLFGLLIGLFYYENKRLSLIAFVFAVFHIANIIIVAMCSGNRWTSMGIYFAGYLSIFVFDICFIFTGVTISKYLITNINWIKKENGIG
jgi:hypothetical protein